MNTIGISVSLLAAVFAFGLFYRLRRLKPQVAGYTQDSGERRHGT